MKIASIDIGTNTILLLIAEIHNGKITKVLRDQQVIARLGKGVDAQKVIHDESFQRAEQFLLQYKSACDAMGVDTIAAVGTSWLRDAVNREEFIALMKEKTGISVELLSGDEEARWTYRGGISEFSGTSELYSVIDIGGGSTEIIIGNSKAILSKKSIDLGSVRITERLLKQSPPDDSALIETYDYIRAHFLPGDLRQVSSTFAVGVAGTLTTLAALQQRLPKYDPEKVSGYQLRYDDVCSLFGMLKDKSAIQISAFPQISPGREDIIVAGIMILMGYMEQSGLPHITVSDRGLRYGIIYREMEKI